MRRLMCILVGLVSSAGLAHADSVVVESYGGARPAEAAELFGPVARELGRQGFMTGASLGERIAQRVSLPATTLTDAELETARKFADSGAQLYNQGNFAQAIKELDTALASYERAPVTLAVDPSLRGERFDALVYLSLAHSRKRNQSGAVQAMSELIRSFPDKEIGLSKFPPDARKLRRKVGDDLQAQGTGRLKIAVDDARTGVFLNERYVGGGSQTIADLVPGRYRVYVQQGKVRGRLHLVDVQPGTEATASITWKLDSALETRGDAVWLSFEDEADRAAHEATVSLHLARALGTRGAAVLGLRAEKGRRSVVGAYLGVDSTAPVRGGVLAADPVLPSESKMADLGRFLAGDESLKGEFGPLGGEVAGEGTGEGAGGGSSVGPIDDGGRPFRTWKWVALLGGAAAIGTGVALVLMHEDEIVDGMRNPDARNTRPVGFVTLGVGAALSAAGVYFWIRDAGDAGASRTALVPTRGGAMFTLSGRF